jgi:hypothetical protein
MGRHLLDGLLQLLVLSFGCFQDRDVGIGVFVAILSTDLSKSDMVISLTLPTVVRLALTNSCRIKDFSTPFVAIPDTDS